MLGPARLADCSLLATFSIFGTSIAQRDTHSLSFLIRKTRVKEGKSRSMTVAEVGDDASN